MNLAVYNPAGSQKLHRCAHFPGITKIHFRNPGNSLPGDALCINVLIIHFFPGCHCRQNGNLAAGVMAFHIRLRISLCIAQLLSLL